MKRLLCIIPWSLNRGGAETFLMKLFRSLDREKYMFDFLTISGEYGVYEKEIKSLGGTVYHLDGCSIKTNCLKSMYLVYKYTMCKKYDSVLLTMDNFAYALYYIPLKFAGVKKVGIRSANSRTGRGARYDDLAKMMNFLPRMFSDVRYAPSALAADFMFGNDSINRGNAKILHNGLQLEKFKFDVDIRNRLREELNIGNKFVVGHVGRFSKQKNHVFLLKIFNEIVKINKNSILLMLGDGPLRKDILEEVDVLGLSDNVIFTGIRSDVNSCYMAMDVMIFPSLYEGMPNVVIEAQSTGLPCIVSDSVTDECKVTDRVQFLSLKDDYEIWAEMALHEVKTTLDRQKYNQIMYESGYDIKQVADEFTADMFNN